MKNLITYFSLIVGDLIPNECEVWGFFRTLQDICSICSCKGLSQETCSYLSLLIREHHEMFLKLFKCSLKPKHHFMLHYPRILRETGPIAHNWGFRFEGKHYQLKQYSSVCRSRINITKSVATRHQMILCSVLWRGIQNSLEIGKGEVTGNEYCCESISTSSVSLSIKDYLMCGVHNDFPVFGKVKKIFIEDDNEVKLVLQKFSTVGFKLSLNAYMLQECVAEELTWKIQKNNTNSIVRACCVALDKKLYAMFNSFDCSCEEVWLPMESAAEPN